ncbi:MAG: cation-transporting ATPase, partial [Renibacterium salmoninarum]|nr:cation-transporting ATPase [Renibacterium salmoninarum]
GGLLAGVAGGAVASATAAPLLDQAANLGVDFDALANMLDVGSISDSFGGFASGSGEAVSGMTEQAGSFADKLGNLGGFPFGDLFKR